MNKVHICETCEYCTHSPNLFQPYYWCSWYGKEVRTPINKCDKIVLKIKSEMSKTKLHKSIQHVTTVDGKLSDKTIKLINKIAKKAYGSK